MFKNAKKQQYFVGIGAVALVSAVSAPASAQSVVIINSSTSYYGVNQNPTVGNFIYGSPIPTPVTVNPITGHIPAQSYFSQPHRTSRFYNVNFINPVLVNPVILKNPRSQKRYQNSRKRRYRQPASRIMINSPW